VNQRLGQWEAESQLQSLVADIPVVGHRAVYQWLKGIVDRKDLDRFRAYVRDNERWLREDTVNWGSVGYAMTLARDWPSSLSWAEDWKSHSEARPWMLVNVSEIFRACGRSADGAEVNQHALTLPPDHAHNLHELWLAWDHARDGEIKEASDRMSRVDSMGFDDDYLLLHLLTIGLIGVATGPDESRDTVLAEFQQELGEFLSHYRNLPIEPARREALAQTLEILSFPADWASQFEEPADNAGE
jgi:hypothetical protein